MTDLKLQNIIDKALQRERLTREEIVYLLQFPEASYESALIRAAADRLTREKNGNAAIIIAQVGVDIHPCAARCKFCSCAEGSTQMPTFQLDKPAIKAAVDEFCKGGDLYGLYLMTMADTDKEYLIDAVKYARSVAPKETQIWINTGDNDLEFFRAIREAGACGAYHVCRLREGTDTRLDPETRMRTMKNIREAGLDLFSCVEPIGPEHSAEELADAILRCIELEVTQFGAMKRTAVPGSLFGDAGQISNLRMAHVEGCVCLAYACVETARFFGIHEPSESGYLAGANFVTAESGVNPRDVALDTSKGRGWDIFRCRKHLFECGFERLLRGDGSSIPLTYDYLRQTDSLI